MNVWSEPAHTDTIHTLTPFRRTQHTRKAYEQKRTLLLVFSAEISASALLSCDDLSLSSASQQRGKRGATKHKKVCKTPKKSEVQALTPHEQSAPRPPRPLARNSLTCVPRAQKGAKVLQLGLCSRGGCLRLRRLLLRSLHLRLCRC